MRSVIKKSSKVINGNPCLDVVKGGKILKTFVTKEHAQAFIVDNQIKNYTKSKSYKEDLALLNYVSGANNIL